MRSTARPRIFHIGPLTGDQACLAYFIDTWRFSFHINSRDARPWLSAARCASPSASPLPIRRLRDGLLSDYLFLQAAPCAFKPPVLVMGTGARAFAMGRFCDTLTFVAWEHMIDFDFDEIFQSERRAPARDGMPHSHATRCLPSPRRHYCSVY